MALPVIVHTDMFMVSMPAGNLRLRGRVRPLGHGECMRCRGQCAHQHEHKHQEKPHWFADVPEKTLHFSFERSLSCKPVTSTPAGSRKPLLRLQGHHTHSSGGKVNPKKGSFRAEASVEVTQHRMLDQVLQETCMSAGHLQPHSRPRICSAPRRTGALDPLRDAARKSCPTPVVRKPASSYQRPEARSRHQGDGGSTLSACNRS